jgi:LPXTG-motif cell wall-anchored protein
VPSSTPTTSDPPADQDAITGDRGALARTGAETGNQAAVALIAMTLGLVLVGISRMRRRHRF